MTSVTEQDFKWPLFTVNLVILINGGEKKDFGFAKNGQLQLSRQGYSQSSAYACT